MAVELGNPPVDDMKLIVNPAQLSKVGVTLEPRPLRVFPPEHPCFHRIRHCGPFWFGDFLGPTWGWRPRPFKRSRTQSTDR